MFDDAAPLASSAGSATRSPERVRLSVLGPRAVEQEAFVGCAAIRQLAVIVMVAGKQVVTLCRTKRPRNFYAQLRMDCCFGSERVM